MNKDIKVVFMGTPLFSVPILEGLIDNYNVVGVVTQPDKPVGRGGKISISPIKDVAINNNIKVLQPIKIIHILSSNLFIIITINCFNI